MGRYTGPVCRLCRREGKKLFLKGERCYSPKCGVDRRNFPPGMHGSSRQFKRKESDYSMQLREKQRARRIYGVMERQFRRYFEEAEHRPGLTGLNLLSILESRLDNVVFRMGMADSRAQARQLVQHGHFEVNGHKLSVPSALVRPGDVLTLVERSTKTTYFKDRVEYVEKHQPPQWLSLDAQRMACKMLELPSRADDVSLEEQLIVEFYSR